MSLTSNLDLVQRRLTEIAESQLLYAGVNTLKKVGWMIKEEIGKEMLTKLEQPITPYTKNSVIYRSSETTKANPRAKIFVNDYKWEDRVIGHLFSGGYRNFKRMERAFIHHGLMRPGMWMIPRDGAPRDAYGNIKGSFVQMLMSYFGVGPDPSSYMTQKKKDKLAKYKNLPYKGGLKRVATGAQYFISTGQKSRETARDQSDIYGMRVKGQNLPPGIYKRSGPNGADLESVISFVRAGKPYQQYFSLQDTGRKVVDENWNKIFGQELSKAMMSSRAWREIERNL